MPFDQKPAAAARAPQARPRAADIEGSASASLRSGRATTPASLLRLQALAGNAAVQRAVQIDELDVSATTPDAADGPAQAQAQAQGQGTTAAGAPGSATLGDGSGPAAVNGSAVDVNAGVINLRAPIVSADGIIRATTVVADNIVASSYTPGAGNLV